MSLFNFTKTATGFSVTVPFPLKNAFKSVFKTAKWNRLNKEWEVGPRSLKKLQKFASELQISDVSETLEISDQIFESEKDLEEIREKIQSFKSEFGNIEDMRKKLMNTKINLEDTIKELNALKSSKKSFEENRIKFSHFNHNKILIEQLKNFGGVFDGREWNLPHFVADKVLELEKMWNSDLRIVEIKFLETCEKICKPYYFMGYTVARAYGRDSGAKLGDNVSMLKGGISSGGSMNNWKTYIDEDSVFRLQVPMNVFSFYENEEKENEGIEFSLLN